MYEGLLPYVAINYIEFMTLSRWTQKPWRFLDFHITIRSNGIRLKTGSLKYFPSGFLYTARNAVGAGYVRKMRFIGNCQAGESSPVGT